jgi:hypothetical protein
MDMATALAELGHRYFARRSRGQQLDQKKYARPETLAHLSPAARFILDV